MLSPRKDSRLGLGCAASLFIPAGIHCLSLILPNGGIQEPWSWGGFLLLAIAGPIGAIWWSRTSLDTEHLLILEHDRITLRTRSFHQTTHELVGVSDETVGIGPGSGLTTDESVLKESANTTTIVIWGPSESLLLLAEPHEFLWLRGQIQGWLQRKAFTSDDAASHSNLNPPKARSVGSIEPQQVSMPISKSSTRHKTSRFKKSPPEELITVVEENDHELHLHIAAGGPAATAFGWNSLGQFLFATTFGLFWYFVAPNLEWMPLVIGGVLWLLTVVVIGVAIRRLFDTVDLELSQECLTVTRTMFGWRRIQRITLGSTPSVQLLVNQWSGSTPEPTLCVKGSDDEARFGTMLSEDEKRWLVMRLRAFLKLDLRANIFAESEGQADS